MRAETGGDPLYKLLLLSSCELLHTLGSLLSYSPVPLPVHLVLFFLHIPPQVPLTSIHLTDENLLSSYCVPATVPESGIQQVNYINRIFHSGKKMGKFNKRKTDCDACWQQNKQGKEIREGF